MVDLSGINVVTAKSRAFLNERQTIDYQTQREACLNWLLTYGKNPERFEGYALGTVKPRSARMDQFYRFVWDFEGRYTGNPTHDHADAWMRDLASTDSSTVHKDCCQKAVKMLLKWRHHEHGLEEWTPEITFYSRDSASNPRDYLSRKERTTIREAALEYGSAPSYSDLTPEARDRWRIHLAQRFGIPKSDVTPADWDRANGWKIPSLVWVSMDAGLRPIEVERATTSWVDLENKLLRIPKAQSSKNRENWLVGLRSQTIEYIERWFAQRDSYTMYDDTKTIWLTNHGNPYSSQSLRYLLHRLFEEASIPTENRQVSWYTIRHSVGTYMTREEDLAAAQAQLRHKSEQTTMKYDQTPVEERRNALDRMG